MKGVVVGLLIAGLVLSCAVDNGAQRRRDIERNDKMNEVTQLWTQIRAWRAELGMDLDPSSSMLLEFRNKSVKDAQKVCPENQKIPKPCEDTCRLSEAICENAESICKIADELGKQDRAQEKCTSAKASCREAKQRCCKCITKPQVDEPAPAPVTP